MAEDICRKSAIIETYVMDSRIGNPQPDDAVAESNQQFGFCFPPICDSGSSFGSYGHFYQPAPQTGSYIWLLTDEFWGEFTLTSSILVSYLNQTL